LNLTNYVPIDTNKEPLLTTVQILQAMNQTAKAPIEFTPNEHTTKHELKT